MIWLPLLFLMCALCVIIVCSAPPAHAGWDGAHCWTMNEVYDYLPKDEVARVEKLEFLDERELVKQLFEHYCITFAWINGSNNNSIDSTNNKVITSSTTATQKHHTEHNLVNDPPLNFDDLEIW